MRPSRITSSGICHSTTRPSTKFSTALRQGRILLEVGDAEVDLLELAALGEYELDHARPQRRSRETLLLRLRDTREVIAGDAHRAVKIALQDPAT